MRKKILLECKNVDTRSNFRNFCSEFIDRSCKKRYVRKTRDFDRDFDLKASPSKQAENILQKFRKKIEELKSQIHQKDAVLEDSKKVQDETLKRMFRFRKWSIKADFTKWKFKTQFKSKEHVLNNSNAFMI